MIMKNAVTIEEVKANMQDVLCETRVEFGKPTTYVTIQMLNGFTLRESTTCVDPDNYSEEIGKKICLKRLEEKVWFLLGYNLQEKLYKEALTVKLPDWGKSLGGGLYSTANMIVNQPAQENLDEALSSAIKEWFNIRSEEKAKKEIEHKQFLEQERKDLDIYLKTLFFSGRIYFTDKDKKATKALVERIVNVLKEFYPHIPINDTEDSIEITKLY